MNKQPFYKKIAFNSPVILGFTAICFAALLLNLLTRGASNLTLFSVYHSSLLSPLTWFRFVGHIFGHSGLEHLLGNIMLILVVGPLLEEKYGSANIALVIFVAALVTGIVTYILFPYVRLLGASGVVFALIMLSSFTSFQEGKIPLTFILVGIFYIGEQIYAGIFVQDNISNMSHIIGGLVGAGLGYQLNLSKVKGRSR